MAMMQLALALLVGYLVMAVTLGDAGNDRVPGGEETLGIRVQERKTLDKTLHGYDLAETLSQHPRLIYSPVTRRELGRALGDASTLDRGRTSAIAASTCASHVSQIIEDLKVPELYALNMLDSMGKPGSGILQGNFQWLGVFDQCKAVKAQGFSGQYCLPKIGIILLGVCVPDSCSEADVETLMTVFLEAIESNNTVSVHCVHPIPWRVGDTIMVVVVAIFVVLVITSTVYELRLKFKRQERNVDLTDAAKSSVPAANGRAEIQLTSITTVTGSLTQQPPLEGAKNAEEKQSRDQVVNGSSVLLVEQKKDAEPRDASKPGLREEVLRSFSLVSNTQKLVSTTGTPRGMESLNGLRVLSMAWVILGHTFSTLRLFISNSIAVMDTLPDKWSFQFVLQGPISVDTFFFLSGFLVAFGTLKMLKKTRGRLNWALFYVARFLRLTPIYMFILFFYITISLHFISGPYESEERMAFAVQPCYENWWTNLLYINNFVPEDSAQMCIQWTWYLANDMQFYIISPLFIYVLYRKRMLGHILILLGILANFLAVGIIAHKYELALPPDERTVDPDVSSQYDSNVYSRTYYRIAPYLIGIACADIYMNTRDRVKNIRATWWKVFVCLMWALSLALMLALIYGLVPYEKNGTDTYLTPRAVGELYSHSPGGVGGLSRLDLLRLSHWVGRFGEQDPVLRVWEPLVRLCFIMYLAHPVVMGLFLFNLKQTVYLTELIGGFWFISYLGVTFVVSVVFFLLVEQPLSRLQRALLKK